MKAVVMLDTLAYANQLKAAGVPNDIAEAHAFANAKMLEGLVDTQVATKKDLAEFENQLKQDINHLEKDFHTRLKDLELRLTIRIGIIITGVLGVYSAIFSSFLHFSH